MSDTKTIYHDQSVDYYRRAEESTIDQSRIWRSKIRENKYNEQWEKHPVDLNDVCRQFAPSDPHGHKEGYKWVFEDDQRNHKSGYRIVCDMIDGYLRVYQKTPDCRKKGRPIDIENGQFGPNETTHYKIRKRNTGDTTAGILKQIGKEHKRRGTHRKGDRQK